MKLYAFTDVIGGLNVQQPAFSCSEKFTLTAGYVAYIDLILDQGSAEVTLIVDKAPKLSTGALIGIIVGGVALAVLIGVGIYCFIKKRKAKLTAEYEKLN